MKKLFKVLALATALLPLSISTACASNQGGQEKTQEAKVVKKITAKEFREKVWDYREASGGFKFVGTRPVILDFYADWCPPCRKLSPKLEELAKKYDGQVDVYKIDVDSETELARVFGVKSIPMLLFIPVEGEPAQTLGDLPKTSLEEGIQRILKK